ncbi:tetratricopeptide repeat protein [Virgibacillus oceani]|uniref:GTP-binding protein n=1 Tax=Virgibacillus oceani TaxID=1479511 RepID=A0A917HFG2_9BACI|nr:hypothetical protein [Virgibacillus oceani]GGG76866.1 hypothetical protein GCM10011398_22360 [Virgibacillus oceani]
MATESELINKSFHEKFIGENKQGQPIKILGEMYTEEMQKPQPNLSFIRFAQGEVYFLNNDYEAAIFKWQHALEEEFIPWTQKNIADAHLEMGLLEDAERFYKQVDSESLALQSEVLLQLFSLYIQQGDQDKAVDTIMNAVKLNPDYSHVTKIARKYLEGIHDWGNAVELAVGEAIRTKSHSWFEVLSEYVKQGLTFNYEPNYFNELLVDLLQLDPNRFELFTELLWKSYEQSDFYIEWLEVINQLLLNDRDETSYVWNRLPILFKEGYCDLISGKYLIRDISGLMQHHLANWLNVSSESDSFISATAILAWNETFPSLFDAELVREAEYQFEISNPNQNGRKDGIALFDSIKTWAEGEGLSEELYQITEPMLAEYNIEVASPSRIRDLVKTSIEFLLEQRVALENDVQEEINRNEDLLTSLHDIHQQIGDMEKEMATVMTDSFRTLKESSTQHVMRELPKLLQDCSELVQEDSDFSKIHIELNEEMNKRIAAYMKNDVLNHQKHTVQKWIEDCKKEFQDSQITCNELSENINQNYGDEQVVLQGDFKVLDDWQRDLERISRGLLRFEKVNVLLRNTPSQLFLKGAGKLLGSISKNKEMLHSKYKNYIENADYSQVTEDIITPFMQQLDLFEGSIEWDISRFFSESLEELDRKMDKVQLDIESHKNSLNKMHDTPEFYRDPLTMFELKLRQYELMNTIG